VTCKRDSSQSRDKECHAPPVLPAQNQSDYESFDAVVLPPTSALPFRMARLLFLTIIFISFVATNAQLWLSSQQPVADQDGAVHTTQGWSWADCGQSFIYHLHNPQLKSSFLFKVHPLMSSRSSPLASPLTLQNPDRI